jgi:hypothetical protein
MTTLPRGFFEVNLATPEGIPLLLNAAQVAWVQPVTDLAKALPQVALANAVIAMTTFLDEDKPCGYFPVQQTYSGVMQLIHEATR